MERLPGLSCRAERQRAEVGLNLAVPDGIRLVFQPAHSPELQPAEHLWRFVDEPSPTAASPPSRASIKRSDNAASLSHTSATPSVTAPSSIGGRTSHQGRNQPESV